MSTNCPTTFFGPHSFNRNDHKSMCVRLGGSGKRERTHPINNQQIRLIPSDQMINILGMNLSTDYAKGIDAN